MICPMCVFSNSKSIHVSYTVCTAAVARPRNVGQVVHGFTGYVNCPRLVCM